MGPPLNEGAGLLFSPFVVSISAHIVHLLKVPACPLWAHPSMEGQGHTTIRPAYLPDWVPGGLVATQGSWRGTVPGYPQAQGCTWCWF